MNTELWAINHKQGTGVFGGVSKEFVMGEQVADMDPRHMDMRAPYYLYKQGKVAAVVGFQGYRKFMNFRDPWPVKSGMAKGWEEVPKDRFVGYQHWLAHEMPPLQLVYDLQKCDVITVEPFDCSYNGNMGTDYAVSRSTQDWIAFAQQCEWEFGWTPKQFDTPLIRPMHFVTRDYTFQRFMRDWESVMIPLEKRIKSLDSRDPEYCQRSLAFLSERFWSLWLDANPTLRVKTVPLMVCWDAK